MEAVNEHRHYSKKDDAELRQIKALPTRGQRKEAFAEWATQHGRTLHAVRQRALKLRKYKAKNGGNKVEKTIPENATAFHGTIEVPIKEVKVKDGFLFISF